MRPVDLAKVQIFGRRRNRTRHSNLAAQPQITSTYSLNNKTGCIWGERSFK